MTAFVTGNSLGTSLSSAAVLGSQWLLGQPLQGRASDSVFVNASTGNLVIKNQDEMLIGRGPDDVIARTYNSLGTWDGDNNDNWKAGVYRKVALTGTYGAAGSSVQRTDWDGAIANYVWNANWNGTGSGAYVSTDGAGAYDWITLSSSTWTWTDGDTLVKETYDNANGGRITTVADTSGNTLSFTYTGSLITRVTTADGGYTDLVYSGTQLTQVTTNYGSGALVRTRYGYDGSNRLTTVTTDLTPGDSSVSDGATYVTTYGYIASGNGMGKVGSITQTDGSSLQIGYDASNRVAQLTLLVSGSTTRVVNLAYGSGYTTVTDPAGTTRLDYDSAGQLTKITDPLNHATQFAYDAKGNVSSITDPTNAVTKYSYDGHGNRTLSVDALGNTTEWAFDQNTNALLREVHYLGASGGLQVTNDITNSDGVSGWALDGLTNSGAAGTGPSGHTAYSITHSGSGSSGQNIAYSYVSPTDLGAQTISIRAKAGSDTRLGLGEYNTSTGAIFDLANGTVVSTRGDCSAQIVSLGGGWYQCSVTSNDPGATWSATNSRFAIYYPAPAATVTFSAQGAPGSGISVTAGSGIYVDGVQLEAGNAAHALVATSGAAASSEPIAATRHVYDTHDRLRYTISADGRVTEYFYDTSGYGLLVSSVDYGANLYTASGQPDELTVWNWTTTVDRTTGQQTDYTYNSRGSIASITNYSKSLSGGGGDTSSEVSRTYFTYDQAGNLTEKHTENWGSETFQYDGLNRLKYSTDLSGQSVTITFADASTTTTMSFSGSGLTKTSVYDKAGELLSVAESGTDVSDTTTYLYDNVGNLKARTDASGTGIAQTTNYLYDADGKKIAEIGFDGSLTEFEYNSRELLTKTVRYGTALSSGTVASLAGSQYAAAGYTLASIRPAVSASDQVEWRIYDNADRCIQTIEGDGSTTVISYDASSRITQSITYANQINVSAYVSGGVYINAPTSAVSVTADANRDRLTRNFYDKDNNLIGALNGEGYLVRFVYNAAGQKVEEIAYATAANSAYWAAGDLATLTTSVGTSSNDRHTRFVYDRRGMLRATVNGIKAVTWLVYDNKGNVIKTTQLATVYDETQNDSSGYPIFASLKTWVANHAASADRTTRAVYDSAGRVAYAVDAEGYVTQFTYDNASNVTSKKRFAAPYSVSDGATTSTMASLIGSPSGTLTDTYTYDALGRLEVHTDPDSTQTKSVYDALGRVVSRYDAYGSSDQVLTTYEYDAVGRVKKVNRAVGTSEVASTQYTYDGAGNQLTEVDGLGRTTTRTYDTLGRVKTVTTPLNASENAVTQNTYDAFGNLVKVIDPRNNAGYFYYDRIGRLTLQLDPERYATETGYSALGGSIWVRRYFAQNAAGYTEISRPTPNNAAGYAQTDFTRDALDRVTSTTDAGGFDISNNVVRWTETYGLNVFGDRTSVTNKLGGTTTNVFDHRGLLTQETLPVASYNSSGSPTGSNIVNKYEYDARGNRTKSIEAYGFAEQRTTTFAYDSQNRLTQETSFDWHTVLTGNDLATTASVQPTQTITYDRRGNVIQTIDKSGARTLHWYDHLDRKIAQLDALGTLSTWTYDANGNVLTARVYGDAVTGAYTPGEWVAPQWVPGYHVDGYWIYDTYGTNGGDYWVNGYDVGGYWTDGYYAPGTWAPLSAGSTPPSPVNASNYRETAYTYDYHNRLITTSLGTHRIGSWNGSSYTSTTAALTTTNVYDKAGNLVQQTDARGNSVFTYYDKLGRKIGQVDAENYVTLFALDAEGNVTGESHYATKLGYAASTSGDIYAYASVAGSPYDRLTSFWYDKMGRRIKEQRYQVSAYNVTGGALAANDSSHQDSIITYVYNGLGEVVRKTEATGEYTDYGYDNLGRQTSQTSSAFTDYNGASVQRQTLRYYDGLNNLTREALGAASGGVTARVTTYSYGAGGRLASVTDAANFTHSYGYDAAGHVVKDSYTRTKSDSSTVTEAVAHRYDLLGREVFTSNATWNGSSWSFGDQKEVRYDAYGEITAKGTNSGWQETFDYDGAGRLWRSNSEDGVVKLYGYDASGNQTLIVHSTGADLTSGYAAESDISGLANTSNSTWARTVNAFDKRGQATQTLEPFGQINVGGSIVAISTSRTYDAFGELLSETDARGYTTNYTYTNLGKLSAKLSPETNTTADNGAVTRTRPTQLYRYDLSGRLIGAVDPNGGVTRYVLLAGTGYGGTDAQYVTEYHADNYSCSTGYDVFGDARKHTDELSNTETRDYDAMGRLTTVTHPVRSSSSGLQLIDYYSYDGLGERLAHWNNEYGSGVRETTEYDLQGRVIKTVDMAGYITSMSYVWQASLATGGMGTYGGWVKTTTTPSVAVGGAHRTLVDQSDYFGHLAGHTDMGGHVYTYTFDKGGRLVHQTNNVGQDLTYTYFNTGKVATIADNAGNTANFLGAKTTYGYDAAGNKLTETYQAIYNTAHYNLYSYPAYNTTLSLQNVTSTYDELNRQITYTDTGRAANYTASMQYEYDTASNVRHMYSSYKAIQSGSTTQQDFWYKYDVMNRAVTTQGVFSGSRGSGTISRGWTGTDLTYDAAGQRASATVSFQNTQWVDGAWHDGYMHAAYDDPAYDDPAWDEYVYSDGYYNEYGTWIDGFSYTIHHDAVHHDAVHHDAYWVNGYYDAGSYVSYTAPTTEYYYYTEDGFLRQVNHAEGNYNGSMGSQLVRAVDTRDQMGRVTQHTEYKPDGSTVAFSRSATYNAISQVTYDQVSNLGNDGKTTVSTTTYSYYDEYGDYLGGPLQINYTNVKVYTGSTLNSNTDTKAWTTYVWWESALAGVYYYKPDVGSSTRWTTGYTYDANGHLVSAAIGDGRPRTLQYITDVNGQILSRQDYASVAQTGSLYNLVLAGGATPTTRPVEFYYYANGMRIGDVGNDGPSTFNYANAIANRGLAAQTTVFKSGTSGQDAADFDQSFDPVNPTTDAATGGSYVVHAGDTLQSIASQVWGDASLWYMLAEANGLTGSEALATGVVLALPNKILNAKNTSDTFKVYDPTEAMGPVTDYRSPKKKKHGLLGLIIAIIAIAVTAIVAPWASAQAATMFANLGVASSTAAAGAAGAAAFAGTGIVMGSAAGIAGMAVGGAIAGAAAAIVTQGLAVATGMQSDFSWKAVGLAAISGGVGGLMGGLANLAGATPAAQQSALLRTMSSNSNIAGIARGAAGNIISQGLSVAVGLQDKFSWSQVAVSGLQGLVMTTVNESPLVNKFASALGGGDNVKGAVTGMAGIIAGAGAKSLIDGSDFGQNVMDLLPSAIMNTIGALFAQDASEQEAADCQATAGMPVLADADVTATGAQAETGTQADSNTEVQDEGTVVEEVVVIGHRHRLGGLSMVHESGFRPGQEARASGVVSTGIGDPGGVSYGSYQLASSEAGGRQVQAFLASREGRQWASRFVGKNPETRGGPFGEEWKKVSAEFGIDFFEAQHAYIKRTHYDPVVEDVSSKSNLDVETRSDAVRDVVWSMSVQHGRAKVLVNRAVQALRGAIAPSDPGYDQALINKLYDVREAYVIHNHQPQLVTQRYRAERAEALRMLPPTP